MNDYGSNEVLSIFTCEISTISQPLELKMIPFMSNPAYNHLVINFISVVTAATV